MRKDREMPRTPFVSVIVPTYRDSSRLMLCLEGLLAQSYSHKSTEILVINNDPARPLESNALPVGEHLRILEEWRPGPYAARNRGVMESRGEILAFIDADCLPESDWIERGVEALLDYPEYPRVGGKIEVMIPDPRQLRLAELYESYVALPQHDYIQRLGACLTGNMFVWKWLFEVVGRFDSNRFSGGDMEWGRRAQKSGYRAIYIPSAVVSHPARSDYSELIKKARRVGGGMYRGTVGSFIRAHLAILWALLPSVAKARSVLRQDGSLQSKLVVICLDYHLRLVQSWSRLKVAYGNTAPRQ